MEGAELFLPFKSHPSQCPHSIFHKIIFTFKFSSVVSWLSQIQNSCSISAGLSLAAFSCRLLGGSLVSFADYFPLSAAYPLLLQCPAQAPPFPVLGHFHCAQAPVPFLLWFSPRSSLWDKCAGIVWLSILA